MSSIFLAFFRQFPIIRRKARKNPLQGAAGLFWFGKKRGRKEDSTEFERRRLTASATFLAFRILGGFEQPITELKTKFDKFVNSRAGTVIEVVIANQCSHWCGNPYLNKWQLVLKFQALQKLSAQVPPEGSALKHLCRVCAYAQASISGQ